MTIDDHDPHAGLSCADMVVLVTSYLEGALTLDERRRFERHLSACEGCRAHLEQMRLTIRTLGRLGVDSLPAGAERDLLEAFRTWRGG